MLTREPQAIEALGTITVLCVGKTGTLTRDRMTLATLHDGDREGQPGPAPLALGLRQLLTGASRASGSSGLGPMDHAVCEAAGSAGSLPADTGWAPGPHRGIREGNPVVMYWWTVPDAEGLTVAVKGAVEAVRARCEAVEARLRRLRETAESRVELRVLAVGPGDRPPRPAWTAHGPLDCA